MQKIITFSKNIYKWSNSWTGTFILFFFIIFFIGQSFKIPSGSMKDTLLIGDHIFSKNFAYGLPTPYIPFLEIPLIPFTDGHLYDGDKPQRGDIIIFRYPNNTKLHFVKRCVGTPGDKLFIKDKNLYLNLSEGNDFIKKNYSKNEYIEFLGDLWLKNPYQKNHKGIHHDDFISIKNSQYTKLFNMGIVKVPENEFFMMGDNRDHSNDSRFWGTVPYGLIVGKPWFVFFSIGKDFNIRYNRILKTPSMLEKEENLEKSIEERLQDEKKDAIY